MIKKYEMTYLSLSEKKSSDRKNVKTGTMYDIKSCLVYVVCTIASVEYTGIVNK